MKINMNYLQQLPIENLSLNTIPLAILLIGLSEFLIFHGIFDLAKKVYNIFSGREVARATPKASFDKSQVGISKSSCKYLFGDKSPDLELSEEVQTSIGNEEVEIVLKSLGIFCPPEEDGRVTGKLNSDDLFDIFEEDKPIITEAKECFDVFDENRDGFIDAKELQRVLIALGFIEGSELEKCTRMIRTFDENNDDRIDFTEFLRFMENIEC